MKKTIFIGTRGSQLALWQANYIEQELTRLNPGCNFEKVIIKTTGDRDQKSSLTQIGGMGVFTKTIEDELLAENIDIAVHSLKDLPSLMSAGLLLGAVPKRAPAEDVLVTLNGVSLANLASNARIATGSIRRRSQLLALRSDVRIEDLRGNIHTRLHKLSKDGLDAIVMAKAAIVRLGLESVKYYTFPVDEMVPGVGQGAIGVQIREDDTNVAIAVQKLNHVSSFQAVSAERAMLHELDSGCQFPVGAFASIAEDGQLKITGFVGSMDGKRVLKETVTGTPEAAQELGIWLAEILISQGAKDILEGLP